MIEVFKTDVTDPVNAETLLIQISDQFKYHGYFDLEGCEGDWRQGCRKMIIDWRILIIASLLAKLNLYQ